MLIIPWLTVNPMGIGKLIIFTRKKKAEEINGDHTIILQVQLVKI